MFALRREACVTRGFSSTGRFMFRKVCGKRDDIRSSQRCAALYTWPSCVWTGEIWTKGRSALIWMFVWAQSFDVRYPLSRPMTVLYPIRCRTTLGSILFRFLGTLYAWTVIFPGILSCWNAACLTWWILTKGTVAVVFLLKRWKIFSLNTKRLASEFKKAQLQPREVSIDNIIIVVSSSLSWGKLRLRMSKSRF